MVGPISWQGSWSALRLITLWLSAGNYTDHKGSVRLVERVVADNERDVQGVGELWKQATTRNYKTRASMKASVLFLAAEASKLQSTPKGGKR